MKRSRHYGVLARGREQFDVLAAEVPVEVKSQLWPVVEEAVTQGGLYPPTPPDLPQVATQLQHPEHLPTSSTAVNDVTAVKQSPSSQEEKNDSQTVIHLFAAKAENASKAVQKGRHGRRRHSRSDYMGLATRKIQQVKTSGCSSNIRCF